MVLAISKLKYLSMPYHWQGYPELGFVFRNTKNFQNAKTYLFLFISPIRKTLEYGLIVLITQNKRWDT